MTTGSNEKTKSELTDGFPSKAETELKGGRVNYYVVSIKHPNRADEGVAPYQAECEDIIRALGMTFDEGNEFKSLWRTAAARQHNGKPGRTQLDQAVYDAQKRVHYASNDLRHYLLAQQHQK